MYTKQRLLALLIGTALACSVGAQAPNDRGADDYAPGSSVSAAPGQVDPPARVARLANFSGNVSYTPAGENDWVQAQLNRPVVTGDKLWTADGARAELQVGSSTVRLDYRSNFDFLNLNDRIAQMELTQGTLNLDVWRLHGDETYEVDTPTIAFIASRVGDYRIDVDPQGRFTTVSARRGGGEVVGEGGKRIVIEEGQSIRFNDSALNDYQVNVATADDFDLYCRQRKERHERAQARNYVSEDVVGYEDLDEYGSWESVPQYGHVWYPTSVAVDWAPYHAGHWAWVDPWGWTWIDDAPWGFAPFHYGRWAYVGSRWGWVPGPVDIAPVYAPALVAFVGGGDFGLSVSFGGPIGWFALGPGDVYFPGYHCGHDYFNRVNVGNTYVNQTVVNNYYGAWSNGNVNYSQMTFANRNAPGALTAVPTTAFAGGQPVATSAVAVNRSTMANARVLPRAMVAPTRTSLVAGSGRASTTPPANAVNRTVVAAHAPAVQPSFAQRQALLQKNAGQPLSMNQMRTLAAQPNARATATAADNVRVVGRGSAARSLAAQSTSNATTTLSNGRGSQAPATGRANVDRTTANANGPAHVRSADFAHPGNGRDNSAIRGSAAQSARSEPNNPRSAAANDNRGPQYSGGARDTTRSKIADTTRAQPGRVQSSTFAQEPSSGQRSNAINRGAEMQQRRATAATSANTRNESLRSSESARNASDTAMRERSNNNRAAPDNSARSLTQRPESTTRSRGGTYAPQTSRSMASHEQNVRPSSPTFSRPSTSPPNYRATEQRSPAYRAEQHAATQDRAPARIERSAPMSSRPTYTLREPQQQRAPMQRSSAPPRPPMQQAPQSMVQHGPPPQQQRGPGPQQQQQRTMARSAPQQQQHAPRGNEKKKDNNGGG